MVELAEVAVGVGVIALGVILMYLSRRHQYARTGRRPDAPSRHLAVVVIAIVLGAVIVVQFALHH